MYITVKPLKRRRLDGPWSVKAPWPQKTVLRTSLGIYPCCFVASTLLRNAMDVKMAEEVPLFLAGVDARAAKKAARRVPKQKKGSYLPCLREGCVLETEMIS